jgi:putative Holliday junction resolvase
MRYLGIDYGLKKIGLALSEGQIASPLKVIEISGLADAVNKILSVIQKEEIGRVIIGVAESGESRSAVKKFVAKLKTDLGEKQVSVIEVDETLSSSSAKDMMIDLGMSEKSRKKEDAYSAVIILQNFLDSVA